MKRTGRLNPMSEKRRAELGGNPSSTFAPKRPQLKTSAMKQTRSRILPDATRIVRERSQGMCEIQLEGCWIEATEKSHRIARGMGGRHGAAKAKSDRPSDLLDACTWCHLVITRHASRVRAKFHGWVLTERQEPTRTKVLRRGEWVFLADDGSIHSYEEAGA